MTCYPDDYTLPPPRGWRRGLHDRIVAQERTIADLRGYLHEAIKAYEALESGILPERASYHLDRIEALQLKEDHYRLQLKYEEMLDDEELARLDLAVQKHRITELEKAVESQKHRIGDLEEALGEAESSEKSLRARCHEQALDLESQKHTIQELRMQQLAAQRDYADLERDLSVQKERDEAYRRAWKQTPLW